MPVTRVNPVSLLGALLGALALVELGPWHPGWLLFKANRLVSGETFSAFALAPAWAWVLLGLWLLTAVQSLLPHRARAYLLALLAALALVAALLLTRAGTAELVEGAPPSARASLAGGVWLSVLAYYVTLFGTLSEAPRGLWARLALVAPGLLAAAALTLSGALAELGLARELASQGRDFRAELVRHLALAGTSVLLATLLGVPAAVAAARREGVARLVLPGVSLLQTVPSLALFGLMLAPLARLGQGLSVGGALRLTLLLGAIAALLALLRYAARPGRLKTVLGALALAALAAPLALALVVAAVLANAALVALFAGAGGVRWQGWAAPLSSLGVRGIGSAPAIIALTLYALLPIVRNAYTGLKEVPRAATEAGRGMGMSPGQLLRRVELPLALPLIAQGVRASAVLTIGIATVAYLIGAGGLGTFIQRGIDQVVSDLILLGAVPVILLALLADGLLRGLGLLLTPRALRRR